MPLTESMIRLSVSLHSEVEPLVEHWLWEHGAQAITSGGDGQARQLDALFHHPREIDLPSEFGKWLKQMPIETGQITCEFVDTTAWRAARRDAFQSQRLGRVWLIPELDRNPPEPVSGELALLIYPDQAFGSGDHATTQLMLLGMQERSWAGKKVLDVGCGTGILAILAEKLGAAACHGFDIDPTCEADMQRHLQVNASQRTKLWIGPLESVSQGRYDSILANVTLNVHRELVGRLDHWAEPGARVLGSGITQSQWEETQKCYREAGWELSKVSAADSWMCFEGRRS